MKALVKHHRGLGLELQDVPFPQLGISDCLIKVEKTGHEFVGTIVEVGSNVTDFSPGDVV